MSQQGEDLIICGLESKTSFGGVANGPSQSDPTGLHDYPHHYVNVSYPHVKEDFVVKIKPFIHKSGGA